MEHRFAIEEDKDDQEYVNIKPFENQNDAMVDQLLFGDYDDEDQEDVEEMKGDGSHAAVINTDKPAGNAKS